MSGPTQDYIILGPFTSPGRARIVNASSPRKWDVRDGYGVSGATVVFMGNGLAKFDVEIACWLPEHFIEWLVFAKATLTKQPRGLRPTALGISHPVLADLGITKVVVEDLTQWDQDEDGLWTRLIKFIEYAPPLPALGKPIAAIPAAAAPTPTVQDRADAELKAKLATFQGLAGP